MRTLGAGCRALALISLLLPTAPLAGARTHVAAQSRWSGELAAGYGSGLGEDLGGSGSLGLHAAGLYWLGGRFATGIEVGYYRLGTSTTSVPDLYGPGSTYRERFGWSALQATGTLRLYPIQGDWRALGSLALGVHARWHGILDIGGVASFATVTVGVGFE